MSARTKMTSGQTRETKIPVVDSLEKVSSNVIECSVNMNVSLSRAKKSQIFQRAQTLFIVIIAVVFAIVFFRLKREVQALEVQMNCVNSNLMILMLRYEKLNKNFNRIWHRRIVSQYPSEEESESSENIFHATAPKKQASYSPPRNGTDIEKELEENSRLDRNSLEKLRTIDNRVEPRDAESADRERYERAIVAFEKRNRQASTPVPALPDDLTDDTNSWNEPRAGRSRRDEGRGKKRRKIKRRLKRSRRRLVLFLSGSLFSLSSSFELLVFVAIMFCFNIFIFAVPLVATFIGAMPEQHVTDAAYVGPWVKSASNDSRYAFNKFHLVEDKTSIEVTANGLYMISAQIYYFGKPAHYSYWILLTSEGTSHTRKVIKCATVSAATATEASCYTSVVLQLRRGDRLHVQQQERDRLINLREGHSYVQIMLLSNDSPRRRGS